MNFDYKIFDVSRSLLCLILAVTVLSVGGLVISHAGPTLTNTLPHDANNLGIQSPTQLNFQDATGTPVISPAIAVTTTPKAFTVPTGAVTMIFSGVSALRYGDNATLDGSGTGKGYKKATAGTDMRYPCAGVATIWIKAETGTSDVDFMFEVLAQ